MRLLKLRKLYPVAQKTANMRQLSYHHSLHTPFKPVYTGLPLTSTEENNGDISKDVKGDDE